MDEHSLGFLLSLLLVFIALSGFMASAETGILALNRHRLRQQAQAGHRSSRRILKLLAHPDRLIGLIRIGSHVGNIAAATVATLLGLKLAGSAGVILTAGLLAFVTLVFAEAGPRTFGANHPERIAPVAAFLLSGLTRLMQPLIRVVNIATNLFFRFQIVKPGKHSLNTADLRHLGDDVFLPPQNQRMLLGVMELDNITVNDVMVPRGEVQGINIEDDIDDIIEQLRRTQHTRLPVYRGELNDCIGILHIRNSTRFIGKPGLTRAEILQYVREPYFVPEGTALPTQLLQFQKLKRRFGLVVDEYGDVQGIVTLEAILEEIVGEFTTDASGNHAEIQPQADGSWLIEGSANIRDINRQLQWQLPTEGAKTLNGLILETLETIPESALSMRVGNYLIEVLQIRDHAVKAARVMRTQAASATTA